MSILDYIEKIKQENEGPRITAQEPRNMAHGGRIGFEEGLKVENLTPRELTNAQKAARLRNISGKKGNQEFIDFVGGDDYVRGGKKQKKLSAKELQIRKKASAKKSRRKLSTFISPEASLEEIVETIHKTPEKITNFHKNTLNNHYRPWFKEEYTKLIESGEPFTRTEVSGRVIQRIKDTYTRNGVLPKEFLPGFTDNPSTKNYDEFFVPKNPKDKIFTDTELKAIKSIEGRSLRVTKLNQKVFDAVLDGINEVDDIAKMLDIPTSQVRTTVNTVMNGMVRSDLPLYLQDRYDDFGRVINNLASSNSLDDLWRRNTKTLVWHAFPDDVASRSRAFQKIHEFEDVIKKVKKEFPGLRIAYDHPAGYAALKSQNINQFLNVTPIMNDINLFKGRFDTQSKNNLIAMEKALKDGDMSTYKSVLKNQRKVEKLWSNLTGGQSTLGQIRLGKVKKFGTEHILHPSKDFITEFQGNIKIRENIAKNLTDENIKLMSDLLPVKTGETRAIEGAKKIIDPKLIKEEKNIQRQIEKVFKDKKIPIRPGQAGFIATDILKDAGKLGPKGLRLLSSEWVWPEIVIGWLDKQNNIQKGMSPERASSEMWKNMTFGLRDKGETENAILGQLKKLGYGEKDIKAAEHMMRYGKLAKEIEKTEIGIESMEKGYTPFSSEKGAQQLKEKLENLKKEQESVVGFYFGAIGDKDANYGYELYDQASKELMRTEWNRSLEGRKKRTDPYAGQMGSEFQEIFAMTPNWSETKEKITAMSPEELDKWNLQEKGIGYERVHPMYGAAMSYKQMEPLRDQMDYMYAGGGIVGIRKPSAIAPTGGPMSQGLPSLYNNVRKREEYKWQK